MTNRVASGVVSDERLLNIPGNASIQVKELVQQWLDVFASQGFGTRCARSLRLVEVSIVTNADEPLKQEARVVLETPVTEDMLNPAGKLHGGCIAYFVDICTTLPIVAMAFEKSGKGSPGVSQNIHIIYHAPASLDDRLKLVNTSTTVGSRVWSSRIEVWDVTHHRLVASATQVKMEASSTKL